MKFMSCQLFQIAHARVLFTLTAQANIKLLHMTIALAIIAIIIILYYTTPLSAVLCHNVWPELCGS